MTSMQQDHGIPDRTTDLESALARQAEIFQGTLVEALGIEITSAGPGKATASMPVGLHTMHPGRFVHGGAIATLGDSCAAWATLPALEQGWNFSTIQFQVNFMRAITEGVLHASAHEVHRGSRTQVLEVRVTDDRDRLVATMTVTQALLAPRD
ncbi:MAG: PaaI family thioesterase [Actinomycetota bacterium]